MVAASLFHQKMTDYIFLKKILICCAFGVLLFWPNSKSTAQISHSFKLNYAGTILKGSVDVAIYIVDKDRASKNKSISFSDEKIKADVSKFKDPVLTVEFSNLSFEAPRNFAKDLSIYINPSSTPKGFNQNVAYSIGPMKPNKKRNFNFEIVPSDTILAGELNFSFSSVVIGKRNFKLKNSIFQLALNIEPPPLFPDDATENELWKIASKLNNVKAYKTYIQRFPQGKSVAAAKRKQRYLIKNQGVKQTTTDPKINIVLRDENKIWIQAKKANNLDGYKNYLSSFPKGKHVNEAKSNVKTFTDSLDVKIVKFTEEELLGRLLYQVDDTMTIGQTYRVRLEISSDTSSHFIEKLIANVEEYSEHPEDLTSEIIQIGSTMHAHLEESNQEGNKNFYIHLFGESNEREVDLYSHEPTIWEWDVKPLKKGFHPLYFTIEIIKIKDGVEKTKVLPVYDREITILSLSVFQTYKIQFISGGIITTLIVVILLLVFNKKKVEAKKEDLNQLIKTKPLEGATALIENDQVKEALNVLDDFLKNKDSELLQELILLKSRLANNDSNRTKAIINQDSALTERNNIKLAVLDIVERSKVFS